MSSTIPVGSVPTLVELLRTPGNWTEVYIDDSVDTGAPPANVEERRVSVAERLHRAGAPATDIDAVLDALGDTPGAASPLCRYVLVKDGAVVADETIPGIPTDPEIVSYAPVPDLTALLKRRPEEMAYVVVETGRDGGEVRLYRVGAQAIVTGAEVQGRTDTLHKTQSGAWRYDHNRDHAEEIWKQTQSQLAARVNEIVHRYRPRLLVIAGDVRARQLLLNELSVESQSIVSIEPTNTRAPGSGEATLNDHISREINHILAGERSGYITLLEEHRGRGDNRVELRVGAIVQALAGAQVETLLVDAARLRDHHLLALASEPWVATAPEEALGAPTLGSVPAHVALSRAALLTDATLVFVDVITTTDGERETVLPDGASAAALLRWPIGPPVPGV